MRFLPLYACAGLLIAIGTCTSEIQASSRLIGVWNNLTPASNKVAAGEKLEGTEAANVFLPDRTAAIGTPLSIVGGLKLPTKIELQFVGNKSYVIDVKEESPCDRTCSHDKLCVSAKVEMPSSTDSTCVSTAVFSLNKPGTYPFQWQNAMLFLEDNNEYNSQDVTSLPFKFGISAWTSTNGIWKKDKLSYAPADPKGAPRVDFTQPLWIFQGDCAWGGGPIPRMYHGCIAHIYNNTGYVIMVRRIFPRVADRSKNLQPYNFQTLIPPYSVVPFAMVWPSKIDVSSKDQVSTLPVEFLMMGISKSTSLQQLKPIEIPGDIGISADAATQLGLSEQNKIELNLSDDQINDIVDNIFQNMSDSAQDISGANKWLQALKIDQTQKYLVGSATYKIFSTTDANNTIYIKKCQISSSDEKIIYTHKTPAFNASTGIPNFTRLIISEKDKKISFDLADISIDAVYEEIK